jgi:hypothetical protein
MHRRGFVTASLLTLPFATARAEAQNAPVVLELFTSQGCSSCPPADALLGRLIHQAKGNGPGVIGLAWHIDYWNNLGWRDPYTRPAWTERQKSYARCLDAEVFTPALVVNGAAMVIGSDEAAVQRAITRAAPISTGVTLRRTASGIDVEIAAMPTAATGLLAIYDPEQATSVGAGENEGRQLHEYRIVREALPLAGLTAAGLMARMTLPPIQDNRGAVLLLQDRTWHVVGAADLPPARGV